MEITVIKKSYAKMTIETPAYYKHGASFYKVLDADNYIEVTCDEDEKGIRLRKIKEIVSLVVHDGKAIEKSSFDEALQSLTNLPSIEAVTNQR